MSDFILRLEEKLKEKGSSLQIRSLNGELSGEWLKKDFDMRKWDGHASVPNDLLKPYPYLTRIMEDYNSDIDIERQAFTNIYWVSIKSFSHPVLVTQKYSLKEALDTLEQVVETEYMNTLGHFEETLFQLGDERQGLLILGENYSYQAFVVEDETKKRQINGGNVPTLLSGKPSIRELLYYKKNLLLHYLKEEELYESRIEVDDLLFNSHKSTLNDTLMDLDLMILEHEKRK